MVTPTKPMTSDYRLLILAPTPIQKSDEAGSTSASTNAPNYTASLFSPFLKGLTGTEPSADLTTFEGYTSHPPLCIRNKYYSADVSLWCDILPEIRSDSEPNLAQWKETMCSTEAREVREVIGGIVLIAPIDTHTLSTSTIQDMKIKEFVEYVQEVNQLRDAIEDESGRDLATIVAVQDMSPASNGGNQLNNEARTGQLTFLQKLEDSLLSDHDIFGWDVILWHPSSELKKQDVTGSSDTQETNLDRSNTDQNDDNTTMKRILEVIELTNWTTPVANNEVGDDGYHLASTDDFLSLDDDFDFPDLNPQIRPIRRAEKDAVAQQSDEFQQEIMGLHFALEEQQQRQTAEADGVGDDLQVQQFAALMERAAAVREAGSEMNREDREKFARREVANMMKDINIG